MSLSYVFGKNSSKKSDGSFYDHVNEKKFFSRKNFVSKTFLSNKETKQGFSQKKSRIEHKNIFQLFSMTSVKIVRRI